VKGNRQVGKGGPPPAAEPVRSRSATPEAAAPVLDRDPSSLGGAVTAAELRTLQGTVGNRTTVARIAAGDATHRDGRAPESAQERFGFPTVLRPVGASDGGHDVVMRDGDGRTTLAERQAHLRQVMLIRQLAAAGLGVTEREARRYLRIGPPRTFGDTLALATGRPAHRNVDEMVQLAVGLPGLPTADILGLAGAPVIGVPALIALGTAQRRCAMPSPPRSRPCPPSFVDR
jgi:hypothetical protein